MKLPVSLRRFCYWSPVEWWSVLAAFLLFRLFDIVKPTRDQASGSHPERLGHNAWTTLRLGCSQPSSSTSRS